MAMAEPISGERQRADFVLSSIILSLVIVMVINAHLGLVSVSHPVWDVRCTFAPGSRRGGLHGVALSSLTAQGTSDFFYAPSEMRATAQYYPLVLVRLH